MNKIYWISREEAESFGQSTEEQVLLEQTPGHYPEFLRFMQRELDEAGGELFFMGPGRGLIFRVGFVNPNNPEGLSGIEVCARMPRSGKPYASETIDEALWLFLEWIVAGTGGEWTLDELRQTGAIYRIPGAPSR